MKKKIQNGVLSSFQAFDQSQPIRSQAQSSPQTENGEPKRKIQANSPSLAEKANEFKSRGNDCVKSAQYEKAVRYYTEAIRLNKSEAVYYTNRALCYLKQKKFKECIDDCNLATELDNKAVKAYYRRMQAHEQMKNGDLKAALNDCKIVLQLEPNNLDAQRSMERIRKLVPSTKIVDGTKPVNWSQYETNSCYERIDFISKAPHLRSKEPLKRIPIGDGSDKKSNLVSVIASSITQENPTKTEKPKLKNCPTSNGKIVTPTVSHKIQIPKTSAQFLKTWLSLKNTEQKFEVLKVSEIQNHYIINTINKISSSILIGDTSIRLQGIYNQDVCKLLGAQLNLNIVREILTILKTSFVQQKLPISNVLNGVVKNPEFGIIGVMMNVDDKNSEYYRVMIVGENVN